MKTDLDDGLIRARPPKSAPRPLAFARTIDLERVFPTVNAPVHVARSPSPGAMLRRSRRSPFRATIAGRIGRHGHLLTMTLNRAPRLPLFEAHAG